MLRLMAIQTVLISVILVGCKDNAENQANTAVPNASLYDIKQSKEEVVPCLTNISGLAECDTTTIAQRRMVLIRGEVLPTEE